MSDLDAKAPLVAVLYETGGDPSPFVRRVLAMLVARKVRCAGFIQHDVVRPGRSRCDMVLRDIASGLEMPISLDRGPGARGCRLDEAELVRAAMVAIDGLGSRPDVLLLNKFGKSEVEGRGFRPLIASAVEAGIPVIVPVAWRNIESWRQFAGDLAVERKLEALADRADIDLLRAFGFAITPFAAAGAGDAHREA